jgi:hypothetical protein
VDPHRPGRRRRTGRRIPARQRQLPAGYVAEHLELAYASTAHGAQGETVATAHLLVSNQTSAASAYVGMTRGRQTNAAHLVADSLDEAKRVWLDTFSRDRADLRPAHAAQAALSAMERGGTSPLSPEVALQRAAFTGSVASSPRHESRHELNPCRDIRTRSPGGGGRRCGSVACVGRPSSDAVASRSAMGAHSARIAAGWRVRDLPRACH